mgnify:CR=1 FL=1
MIKRVEEYLNIIHYCIYMIDIKRHKLSNNLNPFMLLGKIPVIKKKFEEQGTTHLDVVNKVWGDKHYGFSMLISGGGIVAVLTFLIWGLTSTSLGLLEIYFLVTPFHVIAYALVSSLICHLLVFRKDKYIKYFKKLDNEPRSKKWKYALISFLFIFCSVTLWLYSFRFFANS